MLNPTQATKDKWQVGIFSAGGGAIAIMILGAFWPGWNLESTTEQRIATETQSAQVAALAPMCAELFLAQPDASIKRAALEKADHWDRSPYFKGNERWVTLPNQTSPNTRLVEQCTALILKAPITAAEVKQ